MARWPSQKPPMPTCHDMTWHANVTTWHDGYHFISFHPLHYGVYQSVCVCETCLVCLRLWLTPEHLSSDQDASLDPSILKADTLATVPQSPCLRRILPSYSLWDGCPGLGFGLGCGCAQGARDQCVQRVPEGSKQATTLQPSRHVLQPVRGPISALYRACSFFFSSTGMGVFI